MNEIISRAARRGSFVTLLLLCLTNCSSWRKGGAASARPAAKITMERILGEMTNLEALAEFLNPPYTNRQASSYDRRSKSPTEDWFANDDRSQYIRTEEHGGHKEYVMMDADGPGAIVRIWSANAQGKLRLYLNGSEDATFTFDMKELLGGKNPLFPPPISGVVSMGWNLYFPIPYARHMKVTGDEDNKFYYHVNYRTYAQGTEVEDFSLPGIEKLKQPIAEVVRKLQPEERVPDQLKASPVLLAPGEEKKLWSSDSGLSAIDLLRMRVDAADPQAALRGVVLRAFFDGERSPAIECPIGDFFGASPGINPYKSLPLEVKKDGTLVSRWFMPFKKNAELRAVNRTGEKAAVAAEVWTRRLPRGWNENLMHFHAGYHAAFDVPTRPFRDFNYVGVTGRGVFVGDALAIANPSKGWWGEGDEKIYVDGETFPSHFGTGTEDYYGYAWSSPALFQHPYHNQPRCDGPGTYGYTSVNRFHIVDNIPFQKDFRFDMEIWHSKPDIKINYAAVSYWYSVPGSTSNLATPPPGDLVIPKIDPLPAMGGKYRMPGAIEGESLEVSTTGGNVTTQDLRDFEGKWSNAAHAWYRDGKIGDKAEFKFDAPEAGRYEVRANFTKAGDYAIAEISINGAVAIPRIDFYNPEVAPTGEMSLGVHELKKTGNVLAIKILGANEKAEKNFMVGLDYLRLVPQQPGADLRRPLISMDIPRGQP